MDYHNTGHLILVPTPIGNLEDISLRALRILKEVDFILAEDTRKTSHLLKTYEIQTKMISYHKFNEHTITEKIINLLKVGKTLALVSDAGTPGISDPGYLIVKHCIESDIRVECLPGATALIPAIAVAGLPNHRFCFEGFLPVKKGRQSRFTELQNETRTMIFYESPHRLLKTLGQCSDYFGSDRKAVVCREISKLHEEIFRGTISELLHHYSVNTLKGEIVLVVEGKKEL